MYFFKYRNVVGLAIGFAKSITVDMGMCLQGNDESELPEVLFGGCTLKNVDLSKGKKCKLKFYLFNTFII